MRRTVYVHKSQAGMWGSEFGWELLGGYYSLLVGLTHSSGDRVASFGLASITSGLAQLTLGSLLLVNKLPRPTLLTVKIKTIGPQSHLIANALGLALKRALFRFLDQLPDVPERSNARPAGPSLRGRGIPTRMFSLTRRIIRYSKTSVFEVPLWGRRVGIFGRTGAGKDNSTHSVNSLFTILRAGRSCWTVCGPARLPVGGSARPGSRSFSRSPFSFRRASPRNIAYARPGATEEEVVSGGEDGRRATISFWHYHMGTKR